MVTLPSFAVAIKRLKRREEPRALPNRDALMLDANVLPEEAAVHNLAPDHLSSRPC